MRQIDYSLVLNKTFYFSLQGDLTDYFTSFVVAVSRLKKLKPQTNKQLKLVKALMRVCTTGASLGIIHWGVGRTCG